jgi:anti-sigma regulatory factor (Ser/Thr protein kinase)
VRSIAPSLNTTYVAVPSAIGTARTALAQFARGAGASPRAVEAVALSVSEAMTNAVVHAYRGRPGSIQVSAAVVARELWILIADEGCGLQPRAHRPGLGLGLGLISEVSDDLTVVPRAGGGTEVRIRFDLGDAVRLRSASPATIERDRGSRGSGRGSRPSASAMSILR